MRLCFVSRVEESKGLDTIKEIVSKLYGLCVDNQIKIDFYGQKKDDYFDSHLSSLGICKYKGVLQPNEVVPVLKKYDALLFPTHYEGEGCPGILIEALSAGLPIIASDWKDNKEFVINGVNGFLCDTFDAEMYVYAITALFDPILKKKMKYHSYYLSHGFSSDKAILLIKNYLNN